LVASCVFKDYVDESTTYHQKNVGWYNNLEHLEKIEECCVHDTNHEGFNHNSLNWSLHLLSMYIIKMSKTPIIIGVLALMVCSSSSAAAYFMMGDEETSNTTRPSSTGPSSTGPSPGPSSTPPPSYKPAVITNAPPTNDYRYTTYKSCIPDEQDITNETIFAEKIDGAVLNLDGMEEIKGVGYPGIGSMVVHNLSIKGSYKIGEKDYTIDEGVGHKLIKFCQDDGTKATKYDFVMNF